MSDENIDASYIEQVAHSTGIPVNQLLKAAQQKFGKGFTVNRKWMYIAATVTIVSVCASYSIWYYKKQKK